MSDQPTEDAPLEGGRLGPAAEPEPDDGTSTPTTTGHPAVDEVLRSLEDLDGRPVDEHVAAFEDAHEKLRRALSSTGED